MAEPTDDPQPVASRNAGEVIADSATEALGGAFTLWILGGVALSIAGSFAGDMIPSLPPGFAGSEPSEGHLTGHHSAWWHEVRGNAFVLFFAIFLFIRCGWGFTAEEAGPESEPHAYYRICARTGLA